MGLKKFIPRDSLNSSLYILFSIQEYLCGSEMSLPSLLGGLLEITLTVPLLHFIQEAEDRGFYIEKDEKKILKEKWNELKI